MDATLRTVLCHHVGCCNLLEAYALDSLTKSALVVQAACGVKAAAEIATQHGVGILGCSMLVVYTLRLTAARA